MKMTPWVTLSPLTLRTWLGGGAVTVTVTGTPKLLNVTSSVMGKSLPAGVVDVKVASMRRTWACPYTSRVPVAVALYLELATVNPYLVPVQPGPEAGPSSVTVPADLSGLSSAPGLTDTLGR